MFTVSEKRFHVLIITRCEPVHNTNRESRPHSSIIHTQAKSSNGLTFTGRQQRLNHLHGTFVRVKKIFISLLISPSSEHAVSTTLLISWIVDGELHWAWSVSSVKCVLIRFRAERCWCESARSRRSRSSLLRQRIRCQRSGPLCSAVTGITELLHVVSNVTLLWRLNVRHQRSEWCSFSECQIFVVFIAFRLFFCYHLVIVKECVVGLAVVDICCCSFDPFCGSRLFIGRMSFEASL